jgi:hypothetical protein
MDGSYDGGCFSSDELCGHCVFHQSAGEVVPAALGMEGTNCDRQTTDEDVSERVGGNDACYLSNNALYRFHEPHQVYTLMR